jgi:hypothetical protein
MRNSRVKFKKNIVKMCVRVYDAKKIYFLFDGLELLFYRTISARAYFKDVFEIFRKRLIRKTGNKGGIKMKFRLIFLFVLILSLAAAAFGQEKPKTESKKMTAGSDAEMIMNMEKMAWKNLIDKKYDDFAKMLSDDYQGVYVNEVTTKMSEIDGVKKMTFKTADVTDSKVMFPTKDTAIVTSTVKMNVVNPEGKEVSESARTTSFWVKRGKDWQVVYHSNIPPQM